MSTRRRRKSVSGIEKPRNDIVVLRTSNYVTARSYYNETYDVVIFLSFISGSNGQLNLFRTYLVTKATADTHGAYLGGVYIHNASDDTAPIKINGDFMGANHGINKGVEVTAATHGKTAADIGSVFTDGAGTPVTWYLIDVPDVDTLLFISENSGSGDIWNFTASITGNLTYVSGGVDTGNVTVGSQSLDQLKPCIRNLTYTVEADGVEMPISTAITCKRLIVHENYDITDPTGILDNLASQPDFTLGDVVVNVDILRDFQGFGALTIKTTLDHQKEVDVDYYGITQHYRLQNSWTDNDFYIPRASAYQGFTSFSTVSSTISLDSTDRSDVTKPINRFYQYIDDGGSYTSCFGVGYLPYYWATDSFRVANSTYDYQITTLQKCYPRIIDTLYGNITAGTTITTALFRCYTDPQLLTNATHMQTFEFEGSDYVYVDYHTSVTNDPVVLPNYLWGKKITVIDKTYSLIINSGVRVPEEGILFSVSDSFGYATLKLD